MVFEEKKSGVSFIGFYYYIYFFMKIVCGDDFVVMKF